MALVNARLSDKLDTEAAAAAYQPIIGPANPIQMFQVLGLIENTYDIDIAATAMATRIAELEAGKIVATRSIIMMSTVEWANINSKLMYHRYRTNSTHPAITYNKTGTIFIINTVGDYSITANLAVINGNGGEIAIFYFAIRVYAGTARGMLYS